MARPRLARPLGSTAPGWRAALAAAALGAALAGACGGKAVIDGSPGGDAGGGTGGSTTTTWTTGGTGGVTTTTWTGGGHPELELSITGVQVGVNCMPEVPADPLYARFELSYDNSAGTAPIDAALLDPSVTFGTYPDELVWTFSVMPESSGLVPAGGVVTVAHEKVAGSGSGGASGGPCAFCGQSGVFFVNVDVGGSWVAIGQGIDAECAY